MLAIFVGILAEQRAIERRIDVLEHGEIDGFPLAMGSYGDKAVLVCRTGLGEERAVRATQAVVGAYSLTAIVSVRMVGSVPDDLRVGDLVLCRQTYLWREPGPDLEKSSECDRRLLALAEQAAGAAGLRYTIAKALTVAPLKPQPLDREALRESPSLAVVDTEGFWLAEAARERDIPFLSVRAALARSFDRIPQSLTMIAERGYLQPWRTAVQTARRPASLAPLVQLAVSVRTSARAISRFMKEFLREWSLEP